MGRTPETVSAATAQSATRTGSGRRAMISSSNPGRILTCPRAVPAVRGLLFFGLSKLLQGDERKAPAPRPACPRGFREPSSKPMVLAVVLMVVNLCFLAWFKHCKISFRVGCSVLSGSLSGQRSRVGYSVFKVHSQCARRRLRCISQGNSSRLIRSDSAARIKSDAFKRPQSVAHGKGVVILTNVLSIRPPSEQ